jgi:hypothetical protein
VGVSDLHKFHCDFGNGTSCTINFGTLTDCTGNPPNIRPKVEWTGTRTPEIFPKYFAWIHTVNAVISKAINNKHVFVIQDWSSQLPHWEFWVYDPDGNKECIQKGEGMFQKHWINR